MPKYLITRSQYHAFVVEAEDKDKALELAEEQFEEDPWDYEIFWDGEQLPDDAEIGGTE
jgi:hypothetical protein